MYYTMTWDLSNKPKVTHPLSAESSPLPHTGTPSNSIPSHGHFVWQNARSRPDMSSLWAGPIREAGQMDRRGRLQREQ